jgi:hypothetical protein
MWSFNPSVNHSASGVASRHEPEIIRVVPMALYSFFVRSVVLMLGSYPEGSAA